MYLCSKKNQERDRLIVLFVKITLKQIKSECSLSWDRALTGGAYFGSIPPFFKSNTSCSVVWQQEGISSLTSWNPSIDSYERLFDKKSWLNLLFL